MKRFVLFLFFGSLMVNTTMAQERLPINTSKSTIQWIGEYTFYFGGHEGNVNLESGHFITTNDKITGGRFVIDMNSITSTDVEDEEANASLVNHLKDPDFFDVRQFPQATLEITKVTYHNATDMRIDANMTIKGITLPINFNAEADYETQSLTAKFKIDRRRWNVNYTSKLRDGAISDAIGFVVTMSL